MYYGEEIIAVSKKEDKQLAGFLNAVEEFGPEIPIGVTFDLHANVTRRRAELATFIIGYKTNPHRDHFKVGYRAGKILTRTLHGEIKPVMAFNKMRLLKGGGMTIDFLSLCERSLNG